MDNGDKSGDASARWFVRSGASPSTSWVSDLARMLIGSLAWTAVGVAVAA